MEIELDGRKIKVFIERKNNKNMYLRVKADGIHISCNYFVTKGMILSFITNNEKTIVESYDRLLKKEKKKEEFYYLGEKYDVILLDEELSQVSGIELMGKIKEIRNFNSPVIFMTKDNNYEYNEEYLNDGFSDYIIKPIKKAELLDKINKYTKKDN